MSDAKELRLALVLNGGVSLAVWISGVVHEIDRLRRARFDDDGADGDSAAYADAPSGRAARVDVIAGASAGGINGALLAAAIQGSAEKTAKPLRGGGARPLRDVWLEIGDLDKLVRPTSEIDPPSLLQGDEYFLSPLEKILGGLLAPKDKSGLTHPLYLYLTSTALRATRTAAFATSYDTIKEPDHRVVFRFSACGIDKEEAPTEEKELSDTLPLESAQAKRLARAARSTSSFPAAFPPHEAKLRQASDPSAGAQETYLIDGGILDNQPFNPVLDRVSVMEVTKPWRRVLLYVVPYVTETAKTAAPEDEAKPGIVEVVSASGLSRDLPKLTSLERVEAARADGETGSRVMDILHATEPARLDAAAEAVFGTYRQVQAREVARTIAQWVASPESVGTGPLGGKETETATQARVPIGRVDVAALDDVLPSPDWQTAARAWRADGQVPWCWGLTKAERFARGALRELRNGEGDPFDVARSDATRVIRRARTAMRALRKAFYDSRRKDPGKPGWVAFKAAYREIDGLVSRVDVALDKLMDSAAEALGGDPATLRRRLAAAEVVANVAGTRPPPPPPFDFYRVSASGPVLDHDACTPEAKLAGMQLGHFAAFLKQSWRANDWMWGRLDGVAWLGRVLFEDADCRAWVEDRQVEILREELVALADAIEADERRHYSTTGELSMWRLKNRKLIRRLRENPDEPTPKEVCDLFRACKLGAMPDRLTEEAGSRAGTALATRLATVATRTLSAAGSGLPGPARGVIGTTRRTVGLSNSLATTFARAPAIGVGAVITLAALGIVLAVTGSSVAWLTPVLVAVALLGAWSGFGFISSPPSISRALVLAVLLGALIAIAATTLSMDDGWRYVAIAALVAAIAGAVLWLLYVWSAVKKHGALTRRVRGWLGYAMLVLLAASLTQYAGDKLTAHVEDDTPAWLGWFGSHTALAVGLGVLVAGCLLLPLAELLAAMWARRVFTQAPSAGEDTLS